MTNKIIFSLYSNSRGAVIGNLQKGDERLLATTHPATIAAAIFAMAENLVLFRSDKGEAEFAFPIRAEDFSQITALFESQDDGSYISGFAKFSHVDFLRPLPSDNQAEIHLRVAVHHLGQPFVHIAALSPAPKRFRKDLRIRNKYIYFPLC